MRQIEMSKLIGYSYHRTLHILFKPFSMKKWLWLLLIAYLAGMTSGGNFSGNFPGGSEEEGATVAGPQSVRSSGEDMVLDTYTGRYVERESAGEYFEDTFDGSDPLEKFIKGQPAWILILTGTGIVLVLALIIFLTWLSARFKFIWFNSVVNNTTSIKEPFKQYRLPGDSLFKFYLIVSVAWMAVFLAFAYWAYTTLVSAGAFEEGFKWSFSFIMRYFGFLPIGLIIITIVSAIVFVFIEHFVVTIMAMEKGSFTAAAGKFFGIYKENQKDCWLYLIVLIGLGLLTGILAGILAFLLIVVLLLTGGVIFGLFYLLIGVLLKMKLLFGVLAVIMGIPFGIISFLLIMSAGLPFHVFFRCFSLYFLASLNCGYEPLSLEEAAAR